MRATSRLGGGLRADSVGRGRAMGPARAVRPEPPIPRAGTAPTGRLRAAYDFVPRTNGGAAGRGGPGRPRAQRLGLRSSLHAPHSGSRARSAGQDDAPCQLLPPYAPGSQVAQDGSATRECNTGAAPMAGTPEGRSPRHDRRSAGRLATPSSDGTLRIAVEERGNAANREVGRVSEHATTPDDRPRHSPDPAGLHSPGARRAGRSPPRAMSDGGMHTGAVSAVDG